MRRRRADRTGKNNERGETARRVKDAPTSTRVTKDPQHYVAGADGTQDIRVPPSGRAPRTRARKPSPAR
jgi:hypothetical protein